MEALKVTQAPSSAPHRGHRHTPQASHRHSPEGPVYPKVRKHQRDVSCDGYLALHLRYMSYQYHAKVSLLLPRATLACTEVCHMYKLAG